VQVLTHFTDNNASRIYDVFSTLYVDCPPIVSSTSVRQGIYDEEVQREIPMNGGGAGEMEETMMRYAVSHKKAEEDWTRSVASANDDGSWVDKWQMNSLDGM